MLTRALIVVLAVLNLGVAAWWIARPAPPPPRVPVSTAGGAPLQLLAPAAASADVPQAGGEAEPDGAGGGDDAPATPAAQARPAEPPAPQCLRAGPLTEQELARLPRAGLEQLAQVRQVEEPGPVAQYRVLIPPAPDRAVAQAMAARIRQAGFDDLMVLSKGEDANAIALGSYRQRDSAERRVQSLRAAGFPAELRPVPRAPSRWWLELRTTQPDALRALLPGLALAPCTGRRAAR
ncbi:SPOR domain-containing protein [Pseudoxanthomonas taiwanensis]|uniref:Sporulation protein n=1 Tax=Pseudoxanthomonas taiwanensis TaxID=176598 RepID=A0A921TD90_9GAMM|nr:SPOR domain-containing protein [Pseudoxanthomonas taiwanensis]KAF1687068.1 sporulation protein [Pseudoxanthomonas taiwanensis]MBO2466990.1 SPOR domain-containing protein [Xanthomonadaceae bacterium]